MRFVDRIKEAWNYADAYNRTRLVVAFPEMFDEQFRHKYRTDDDTVSIAMIDRDTKKSCLDDASHCAQIVRVRLSHGRHGYWRD